MDYFFHYVYPFLPFFHKPTFLAHMEEQPVSLLSAMQAFGLRFYNATLYSHPDHSEADSFFYQSRRLVDREFESPKLSTLQTVILLSVYAGSMGFFYIFYIFMYFLQTTINQNSCL
jgi:hypothetical protein